MRFFRKPSLFLPEFSCILLLLFVVFACEGISSTNENTSGKSETNQANRAQTGENGFLDADDEDSNSEGEQTSRGLDMSLARTAGFVFEEKFPLLYKACQKDQDLLKDLKNYSQMVLSKNIVSEESFLQLLQTRDSSLIPYMTPIFENMDAENLDQNWGDYQEELKQLGMTMTAAEGLFSSMGSAPFLEETLKQVGSPEFQAYVKFFNAKTESRNGEYPFQNMKPFRDMVLAGEIILESEKEQYKAAIDADFQYALEAFTDVHYVSSPGTRQVGVALVGGTRTDPYPSLAELETAKEFVASDQVSKYKKALSEILKNPSEITERPENIYVVVIEWTDTKALAQKRVRSHLRLGQDVPHYLKIDRGDGTNKYAVSYRFFEDEEKANAAYDEAIKEFPNAEFLLCSVKGEKLYQLGI